MSLGSDPSACLSPSPARLARGPVWLALVPLWLALAPGPAWAQEAAEPDPEETPVYTVAPPPTKPGQRVAVVDRIEAELRVSKQADPQRSGIAQRYEDTWLRPDQWNNQLDARRVWSAVEDLSPGQLSDDGVEGFEMRWGILESGIYYTHKQHFELTPLLNLAIYTERPQGGAREGSLEMPAGVIPATPVQVGQTWDVDPMALARWGRMGWGQALMPQPGRGRLAKVEAGTAGPVLEVRWSGKFTLSEFSPPEDEANGKLTRPTTVRVDVKLLQPTAWEVGGDAFVLQIKSRATVGLPKGEAKRIEYDWTREVRRVE